MSLKVGDKVKVKTGKEHDPSHEGMVFEVVEIIEGAIALKMPDGQIHKWYTEDELQKVDEKLELRKQKLSRYKKAAEELFGGPGSGRHPGGSEPRLSSPEGKLPKDVSNDIAKIAKVPKEERTEAMVTTMLKNMPIKTLKTLTVHNENWLKQNTHIKETPKWKAIQREAIVGRRILTDHK